MSLFDTIIGRQQLQSLPPEMQDQARTEARREFWINTLLGGRGLASGLEGARQVVPSMQQSLQAQRMEQARQQAMVPTGRLTSTPLPGSQLGLLQAQMGGDTGVASLVDDPIANRMTMEPLLARAGGTGMGGTGMTPERQLTPEMELDERQFAELAAQIMPASSIRDILQNFKDVQPKVNDQGIMTDIRGRVIGSIPTFKDGIQSQFDPQSGSFVAGAVPGFREGQMLNFIPSAGEGVGWSRDPAGNWFQAMAPGAAEAMATTGTIRGLADVVGQTEEVMINGVPVRIPRSAIVGTPQQFLNQLGPARPNLPPEQPAAQQPVGQQPAGQQAQGRAFQTRPTAAQETLDAASRQLFEKTGNEIIERARLSNERLFQSEEAYNAAERIDPNALTSVAGALTPWLRLIPGFGDSLAQFGTDFSLLRQRHSRGILRQFEGGAAKGNLNDREVRLFQSASWQMNDPKEIIQYIAATESALADKDLARLRFYEQYIADGNNPAQFNTAWENAPENIRVYDHPMFIRFLNDRVRDSFNKPVDKDGRHPPPVLPPGHKIVEDERTGQLGIRNPDGRVLPLDF